MLFTRKSRFQPAIAHHPTKRLCYSIDVDYPIQCDDDFWETGDTNLNFVQPLGRPSHMAGFISHLRLCDIVGSMLRTLYSTRKYRLIHGLVGEDWQLRVVAELDASLIAWRESLPPHREYRFHIVDEPSSDFHQFIGILNLATVFSSIRLSFFIRRSRIHGSKLIDHSSTPTP